MVKSCVFRYEFELIHPFLDGNGRCGIIKSVLAEAKKEPEKVAIENKNVAIEGLKVAIGK